MRWSGQLVASWLPFPSILRLDRCAATLGRNGLPFASLYQSISVLPDRTYSRLAKLSSVWRMNDRYASIFDGRGGRAATRPAPALAAPRCGGCAAGARWCRSSISRRDRSAGSVPRCQAASPWSGSIRSGRATAGLGGDSGGAGTLADEWRAPTTAPVTVRDRSPGPILRNSCVARAHRRARRQQIIGSRWE